MEQLDLTIKQLLFIIQSKNYVTEGYEGKIYRIPGREDILLKVYREMTVPKHFVEKTKAFHDCYDLDDIITRPLNIITLNKIPIGYTMKDYGISLEETNLTFNEKLDVLEQCRQIIIRLHQKGIILGDIKLANFLYKDGKVKICDICNAKIQQYEITVKNTITQYHEKIRHVVDENTDIQVFNYMTYIFLKYSGLPFVKKDFIHDFRSILQHDLQLHGTPNFLDDDAKTILKNIYEVNTNGELSNEFLLDHVK